MAASVVERMGSRMEEGLRRACALGATAAKIAYTSVDGLGCSFEAGRLKQTESRQSDLYTIEVLARGRRGWASGNAPGDLEELVARAVTLAKMGGVAHFEAYPAPAPATAVQRWASSTAQLGVDEMIAACQVLVERLRAHDPDLYIMAGAERNVGDGLLVTTGGVSHATAGTQWELGGMAQRTDGTDMLMAWFDRRWRERNELFDPEAIAERIITDLRRGERTVPAPEGSVPIYVEPRGLAMLLWPVTLGVNGRNVFKGDSPLRGRIGEQVLDPGFTIIDRPHRAFAPGATAMDGDGIPTREASILRGGVLQRFLYDLDTAGMAGVEPTGNTACGPYALEVLPGERPSGELLASISDGLYVKTLLGFGQSNIINGDFSCNVGLGFRIVNGEVVGRVKNTMVSGNVYELLRAGVELSSDRDVADLMPSAVIPGVHVSSG